MADIDNFDPADVTAFLAAFAAEGGTSKDLAAIAKRPALSRHLIAEVNPVHPMLVDCSGDPPTFFSDWTYDRSTVQPPNLYKGVLNLRQIKAVFPSQRKHWNKFDDIQDELKDRQFAGLQVAYELRKPEHAHLFPAELKTGGKLVFAERILDEEDKRRFLQLGWSGGQVYVSYIYADGVEGNPDCPFAFAVLEANAQAPSHAVPRE